MLVTGLVVAHARERHRLLGVRERDLHGAVQLGAGRYAVLRHSRGRLQGGEGSPGVAAGDPHEVLGGVVGERVLPRQPALVGDGRGQDVGDLVVGQRRRG